MILATPLQDFAGTPADWRAQCRAAHDVIRERFKPLVEVTPGVWVREAEEPPKRR